MIIHVDMDAFYASVEIRDCPALRGQPVVVGGLSSSRGVVCAANYIAREYGVHSAMPSKQALERCPHAVFIQPRMSHYADISQQIRKVFLEYTPLVEPLSLDEAFLDVTGSKAIFGEAATIAAKIQSRIENELGLGCSAGVAPNKYIAKIASDLEKPNGLVVVAPQNMEKFLDPLSIGRIWGIGKQCQRKFSMIGIKTISDLKTLSIEQLKPLAGSYAEQFWNMARGIDTRKVVPDRSAKTISHETTFPKDVFQWEVLESTVGDLAGQVARRLRQQNVKGRTVQTKVRFSDFHTVTRTATLAEPSDLTREIVLSARSMVEREFRNNRQAVRLVGVGLTNLVNRNKYQGVLFDQTEKNRQAKLDNVTDKILAKFGTKAIKGADILKNAPVNNDPQPGTR